MTFRAVLRQGYDSRRHPPRTSTAMLRFRPLALYPLLFILCGLCTAPAGATESTLTTPRGATVEMLVDLPDGPGPHPALVLAPGQGYHARLPLLERVSKDLVARGVAVVRFNWAYFVKDAKTGKPADDLATEVEDMQAVLAAIKKLPRVDARRIAVGGKSLGSLVSWRVFRDDASLRAGALLTPVCIDYRNDGKADATLDNYPKLSANTRPLLLVSGDTDPLCPNRYLYSAAATIASGTRIVVPGGNHNFATKEGADPKLESDANLDVAVRTTVEFVAARLRQ